jgi:GDP-4-dehydro-6-deoxy-D-mannose reductase
MAEGITLVTGATGFAGRHLLDRLGERAPVVAWHRPGGHPADRSVGQSWQAVDITRRDDVVRAVADVGPSRIFHLAGAPNVAASWQTAVSHLRVNVLGTHHLLEAVRLARIECRVLVVSSGQIYRPSDDPVTEDAPLGPSNPYALSKLAQDQLAAIEARDGGMDIVLARPFNHIGPRQEAGYAVSTFAEQIARIERGLHPPELRVGNLDARRDITDVRDVVRAYVELMNTASTGRAFNVCSGRSWSIRDLLDELLHLSTTPIRVEVDPARFRPNDVPVVQGDGTRIRTEIGWTPTIPVERTLRDTLDWWREEVAALAG